MSKMGQLNLEIQEKIGQYQIEGFTPKEIAEKVSKELNYKISEYYVRQKIVEYG